MFSQKHRELNGKHLKEKTEENKNKMNKKKKKKKTNHGGVSSVSRVFVQQCFSVDSTIHWIKRYPADTAIGFPNTYSLDSDLSDG